MQVIYRRTTKTKNIMDIKKLAKKYFTVNSLEVKNEIKNEVCNYFKGLTYKNKSQSKRDLQISYLGSINSSAKIVKNEKKNYYTYIIYMLPAIASLFNVCPKASEGCIKACLNLSGRVKMDTENNILSSRLLKTWLFYSNRDYFVQLMFDEIQSMIEKGEKNNMNVSARINGTSDLNLEVFKHNGVNVLQKFPQIKFYDYTKVYNRLRLSDKYDNYHLTFSYSEDNYDECVKALENGYNIAVPFLVKKNNDLPEMFMGFEVGDADETDLRFLDKHRIAGLRVKLIKDKEAMSEAIEKGFIVSLDSNMIKTRIAS